MRRMGGKGIEKIGHLFLTLDGERRPGGPEARPLPRRRAEIIAFLGATEDGLRGALVGALALELARGGRRVSALELAPGPPRLLRYLGLWQGTGGTGARESRAPWIEVELGPRGVRVGAIEGALGGLRGALSALETAEIERLRALGDGDLLLVDLPWGAGRDPASWSPPVREVVAVVPPVASQMLEAFRLFQEVRSRRADLPLGLMVHSVRSEAEGAAAHSELEGVVRTFLGSPLNYLGTLPLDESFLRALLEETAPLLRPLSLEFRRALYSLAQAVLLSEPLAPPTLADQPDPIDLLRGSA